MTTETAETPEVAQPTEPPLPDDLSNFGRLLVLEAAIKDYVKKRRPLLFKRMRAVQLAAGTPQFRAKFGGESDTVTFTIKKDDGTITVKDEDAFLAWVEAEAPSEIETIIQVRDAYQSSIIKKAVPVAADAALDKTTGEVITGAAVVDPDTIVSQDGEVLDAAIPAPAGTVVHKDTGKVIPGLKHSPGGDPTQFGTSWAGQGKKFALGEVAAMLAPEVADEILSIEAGGDQ